MQLQLVDEQTAEPHIIAVAVMLWRALPPGGRLLFFLLSVSPPVLIMAPAQGTCDDLAATISHHAHVMLVITVVRRGWHRTRILSLLAEACQRALTRRMRRTGAGRCGFRSLARLEGRSPAWSGPMCWSKLQIVARLSSSESDRALGKRMSSRGTPNVTAATGNTATLNCGTEA
jgi:hypothetical protein